MDLIKDSYIGFLNMDHRIDRQIHMNDQLKKVGIKANRHRGKPPEEFDLNDRKIQVMKRRTVGAVGCHYGQVEIMKTALDNNQNAIVFEDDLIFCEDFKERLQIIEDWTEQNPWDVFWLGGTFHSPAYWHTIGHNRELPQCHCTLGRDCVPTADPRIMRTYGAFCTYAYIVNIKSLEKVLNLLDENVALSMGIDWLFILLQPRLKCYAFVPGSVKQMDNQSDIGNGMTMFSGFKRLNGTEENSKYWFQNRMEDFDPNHYLWV